jgi:hypothetical protein
VAEGGGLLNRYTVNIRIVGSNPIPSANPAKFVSTTWPLRLLGGFGSADRAAPRCTGAGRRGGEIVASKSSGTQIKYQLNYS